MKISVKLLKGDLFQIDAELTDTVGDLKNKIQEQKSELSADRQKLIHAGKVLKDTQSVGEIGVSEADFLVCMVSKETAAPKPKPAPTPVAAPVPAPVPVPAAAPSPVPVSAPVTAPAVAAPPAQDFATPEGILALTGMGFPEAECRAALQAAMGNPDLAYEFLLTGIPEQTFRRAPAAAGAHASAPTAAIPAAAPAAELVGIQQLRNHPQFNMLKQLIQTNPAALPQVLNLIGQQSPALLQAIHANEQDFLALMNEPITAAAPAPAPVVQQPAAAGMPGGLANPAQMIQLLASMQPAQRAQFAQTLGLSPEQLNMFMQMVATMPPEQLQQMLASGLGPGGAGGPPPGAITLTHEEMESVNRLVALGFTQQQAAQAFIACDRNENLAANFLFENGWGDEGDMGGDYGGDEGDDDMYN